MGNLTLTHERIDDIPLLISLGQILGLDKAVDTHLGTHGLQQGLTNGELVIVWQAYILSEGDHRKSGVEAWAWKHRRMLGYLAPAEFEVQWRAEQPLPRESGLKNA